MTRIYEELFIVKPDAPDEEVDAFVETLKTQLTTAGATVDKVDKWGKRRLAYRVDKYREGTYVLFQFSGEPNVVKELERRLRVSDVVLKFLTVRIDETLEAAGQAQEGTGQAGGEARPECPGHAGSGAAFPGAADDRTTSSRTSTGRAPSGPAEGGISHGGI